MTPAQFLKYHLALLLASHGRTSVLRTLAALLRVPETELQDLIAGIDHLPPKNSKLRKHPKVDPIEEVAKLHPEKADSLRILSKRFQNKTFLPATRDVRRFFEHHSHPPTPIKSRASVLPKLARLLGALDLVELKALCEMSEHQEYSSLGIISDQILRRDHN